MWDTGLKNDMRKNRKLIWQIFPSFLIIILLSLAFVASYSTHFFKSFYLNNAEKELTVRAKLLQQQFADMLIMDYTRPDLKERKKEIDQKCKDIGSKTGTRVTIILPSGQVIGDSTADISVMENHRKRPEIMEALKLRKGMSIRYSETLDKNMMYIALPVIHDTAMLAVIRTAISISAIDKEIKTIRNNVMIVLVLTTLAAAAASLYVSRRITYPIEQMKKGAARFAKGKLDARLAVPASEELSELAVTMNQMAQNLDEKIKAFKNRSMELEAVHTSMAEGVIAVDKDEKIITINQAAAKIFDFPANTLKAKYILEVARNLEFRSFIQQALATSDPIEEDICIKTQEDCILNIHSTALHDTLGRRMGTLMIFHDITRIRRLERMHKDFAANVSHELKTPLTTIKGFVETLQQMLESNDTVQSETFLNIIEKNVNRMTDLIDDLLALSKLERLEGTDIRFEKQDLSSLIQGAVNACTSAIQTKHMTIRIDCIDEITVMVDPILMEQAIINLVDNAVKYSPESSFIDICARVEKDFVDLEIRDQGCGISQAHLPKIFNRFYRVDKARSRHEGGTGLGLAIVKHIIQYHQGKLDVTSAKDQGTCFIIRLPLG